MKWWPFGRKRPDSTQTELTRVSVALSNAQKRIQKLEKQHERDQQNLRIMTDTLEEANQALTLIYQVSEKHSVTK